MRQGQDIRGVLFMRRAGRLGLARDGVIGVAGGLAYLIAFPAFAAAGPVVSERVVAKGGAVSGVGAKGSKKAACMKHIGRGWAPTEHFARLKAWEVVAQATGNWPIQGDEFRATHYQCRADRGGRFCRVSINVCRSG